MDGTFLFPGVCMVVLSHSDELRRHLTSYPTIYDFVLVTEGTPSPTGPMEVFEHACDYRLGIEEIHWNRRYIWIKTEKEGKYYIIDALKEEFLLADANVEQFYDCAHHYFQSFAHTGLATA